MMYGDYDDDDSSSSDASSDFLSPFAPFRRFHRRVSTPWHPSAATTSSTTPATTTTSHQRRSTTPHEPLARVQDTSWIGASVSPIASFDDDEEDLLEQQQQQQQHTIGLYRKALQDSFDNNNANERSSLLGDSLFRIHPLWNDDNNQNNNNSKNYGSTRSKWGSSQQQHQPVLSSAAAAVAFLSSRKLQQRDKSRNDALLIPKCHWILFLSFLSALHFSSMAIYDAFWWWHSTHQHRSSTTTAAAAADSIDNNTIVSPWNIWWLSPSSSTLTRFGALVPWRVLILGEYWRILSSAIVSTSFLEWIVVIWSWRSLRFGRSGQRRCATVYVLSLLTGQLWMMAWDVEGVAGCYTWGSCGVLCAVGAAKPHERFHLYLIAILLVLIALFQPNQNSIWGITGSGIFGLFYYGAGLTPHFESHHHHHLKRQQQQQYANEKKGVTTTRNTTTVTNSSFSASPPPISSSTTWAVVSRLFCVILLLTIWVVPLLWIAFQFPLSQQQP